MFKLGSDLGTNSNEIINRDDKKKKNVLISQQHRQPAYLENFFNKMKNSNEAICIVGDTNLNFID